VTQRARTFKNKARRILKHNGRAAYQIYIRAHNREAGVKLRELKEGT
jgi:hypothetical protein